MYSVSGLSGFARQHVSQLQRPSLPSQQRPRRLSTPYTPCCVPVAAVVEASFVVVDGIAILISEEAVDARTAVPETLVDVDPERPKPLSIPRDEGLVGVHRAGLAGSMV
eukprot:scaffold664_cov260-Pinguiococcus_pyrenoidosus.AAC.17